MDFGVLLALDFNGDEFLCVNLWVYNGCRQVLWVHNGCRKGSIGPKHERKELRLHKSRGGQYCPFLRFPYILFKKT